MSKPLDPTKAASAAAAVKASLSQMGLADDDQLVIDSIEGETDFFEIIDRLLLERNEAIAMADGVGRLIDDLKARQDRLKKRGETLKALIEQAMLLAEIEKPVVRPGGTLSLARRAPALEIIEEAEIPARFWVAGDPKLDKKSLTEALRARAKALDEAAKIEDADARLEAIQRAALEHPDIPGATLGNGSVSLTIRVK